MTAHGKRKKRRPGVHKNARSPETLRWEHDHLVPPRPPWMDKATYRELVQLRKES